MWHESLIHRGIDWQGLTVDGFRPKEKILKELYKNKEPLTRRVKGYRGYRADSIYCWHALPIRKEFHDQAKSLGYTRDDKCLTHFLVPRGDFAWEFDEIGEELKSEKSILVPNYRIIIFQFPKGTCDVYKECMENLIEKMRFGVKENYKDKFGCGMDLQFITKTEIESSEDHIPEVRMMYKKFSEELFGRQDNSEKDYVDDWPLYHDFCFGPFKQWYYERTKGAVKVQITTPHKVEEITLGTLV